VSNRYLAAYFYLPRDGETRSLRELVDAAGMKHPSPDGSDLIGEWGGMESVEARVHNLQFHVCLELAFRDLELLELHGDKEGHEDQPLAEDPALPVAEAFREACERLRPELAVIATHTWQASPEYWYASVLAMDANLLDYQAPGLMYASPEIAPSWKPELYGGPRDSLPTREGRIMFRGTGWGRWF
jgi:hypothetical protein